MTTPLSSNVTSGVTDTEPMPTFIKKDRTPEAEAALERVILLILSESDDEEPSGLPDGKQGKIRLGRIKWKRVATIIVGAATAAVQAFEIAGPNPVVIIAAAIAGGVVAANGADVTEIINETKDDGEGIPTVSEVKEALVEIANTAGNGAGDSVSKDGAAGAPRSTLTALANEGATRAVSARRPDPEEYAGVKAVVQEKLVPTQDEDGDRKLGTVILLSNPAHQAIPDLFRRCGSATGSRWVHDRSVFCDNHVGVSCLHRHQYL
ncbi:hypothetical protein M408DRAFT_321016 [Serendipita vermifera MAFF 305830]|uniref:Uncharacterized protein n=1 Tax=Serendipita vermifera MAFF 305830 TaxID=933852 RepID=A0A0C3AVY9_SERVB|nr:hypothetical protein M408DRAFT_321016 [Serendipita vermifera MAFF 305830]